MKLAIVYNPNDSKLLPSAYSWTYRDMFLAVIERFAPVQRVTESCEAAAIEADAILFYDVHSSHHIEIAGIERHPAIKIEYFNDPHQAEQRGTYRTGQAFHKLGPEQRCERAKRRGVSAIMCPYRNGWHRFLAPHAGQMELLWFPVAPANRRRFVSPLAARRPQVLANGHIWQGENGFRPYEFRRWAFEQPEVTSVDHTLASGCASGVAFQAFVAQYAAALALCDEYVVPKYLEIPLAGSVCICQMLEDYRDMGFADGANCIAVDRSTFNERLRAFLADPSAYQAVADAGREMAANRYTARHFAEFLYENIEARLSRAS